MKSLACAALVAFSAVLGVAAVPAHAQGVPGTVIIPDVAVEHPGDRGVRAHTHHRIFIPARRGGATSPAGETPASIRPIYNLPASGGSGTIAIVDAYHYPTAANDLSVFSSQLGLPPANFQVVY